MTSPVSADRRYTRGRRCPICGGAENAPRGAERRCTGFLSDDGDYAHCSREEHAGEIKLSGSGTTYGHRLRGPCKCGAQHGEAPTDAAPRAHCREAATYDYLDEAGAFLYQVVRYEPKDFRQRRRDPAAPERWIWSLGDTRRVLYRLDRVREAEPAQTVYVVEGEKDVESLEMLGLVATCNPGGAGKWHTVTDCASKALAGRHIVVIADCDEPGRKHAADVLARLRGVAASVRIIEPAHGKDATDWIAAGATVSDIETAPTSNAWPASNAQPPTVDSAEREYDITITRSQVTPSGPVPGTFDHDIATGLDDIQRLLGVKGDANRKPLFEDAANLFTCGYPDAAWLVQGLITRMGTAIMGAAPKAGKTWAALEIAIAITTGTPAFGEFKTSPGRVSYFFAEDLKRQVRNRVRATLAGRGLTHSTIGDRLHVCPRGQFLDITKNDDLAWLIASARKLGKLDLLVLDPLRDISSAAEDKSDEMGPVMKRLRLVGELLGCTVLVVHHKGKPSENTAKRSGGQQLRGSGAIHGSTDSGIYIDIVGGDGVQQFDLEIESQVKGAKSAGKFKTSLSVTDDDGGEAVRADWRHSRAAPGGNQTAKGAKDAADDDVVFEFVRTLAMRGEHHGRTALKEHDGAPIGQKRLVASLDRLLEAKRLRLMEGKVMLPESAPNRGDS
jgi:5S rRNA maturation endonuclease (ribonuclease M5)